MLVSSNAGSNAGSCVTSGGLVVLNGNILNSNISNVVPGNGVVGVEPIQATIWHCLNNYAYSDACFLAERVHAEAPSEETLHVLSSAYYRCGQKTKTYVLLSTNLLKCPHYMTPKNRYLLALVCFELEKYAEAETTLLKSIKQEPGNLNSLLDQLERTYGDICAFAIKLYALVCVQTERNSNAFEGFSRCLKLNPFLWNCYEHCCNTISGADKIHKNKSLQRVFQLPDSTLQSQSTTCSTSVGTVVSAASYLPVLIGSTAASLVLQEPKKAEPSLPNEGNYNQNNQNYYDRKDVSLNSSSNFTSSGQSAGVAVLHPSNRNNIKPSKRNLFASTPQQQPTNSSWNGMMPVPLHMDSSNASTVNSNNSAGINTNMSPYSPLTSDFEHDVSQPIPTPTEPKPKKPCLRTSWQQHQTQGGSGSQMQGTVTISTSSNATVRRSSRLFTTHQYSHSQFLKENHKSSVMSTPPCTSVNAMGTPESGSGGRRNKKANTPISSVLKPKLRHNKNNVGSSSSTSSSTVTGETNPENKSDSTMDKDFYKMVMESSEEVKEIVKNTDGCSVSNIEAFRNGVDPLLHILSNLSAPYTSQTTYNCVTAISQYQRLKPSQQETGWVVGNVARCYFELGNYEDSIKHYRRMMELEPWRTDGLEWLSTAYWHLQKETELSALAQDLMKSNRTNEVATWVAAGNCFSLHKEHETAIKFFKRAMQVNSSCAYAYTLLGHEYVLTEELEKAMRCYRAATRIDNTHYNAWYGMGMIFYKQERYERAEVYYRKALAIHPNNSVLLCHLGVVQHALGKPEKSLTTFTRALEANTHDPLCKFHRASVLFGIGKLDEALEELEELKEIVPKESLVYFLIAKIFSKKGDTHKALLHFSWATDLDPKGANNQIKESIEPVLNRTSSTVNVLLHNTANGSIEETRRNEEEEEDEEEDDDDDEEDEEEDDEEEDDDEEEEEETQTPESRVRNDNLRVTRSNRRSDDIPPRRN